MSDKISQAFGGFAQKDRYEQAERFLFQTLEGRRLKLGDTHPDTLQSWKSLINLYKAWNKSEEAEEWQEKLSQLNDAEKPD